MNQKIRVSIIFIFFIFSAYAEAQTSTLWGYSQSRCSAIFGGGDSQLKKAVENMEKLNPELFNEYIQTVENPNSLAALYLFIKTEAWNLMPNGYIPWKNKPELSESFLQRLRETYKKQYRTENMSVEDLYAFYSNALHSQYMALARNIQLRFVENFVPEKASKELKEFALKLLDQMLSNLYLRELEPERARNEFLKDLGQEVPWKEMVDLADQLYKAREQENFNEREWLEKNPVFQNFSPQQKRVFLSSLENRKNSEVCCMTTPGCFFCPNNRGFLRE